MTAKPWLTYLALGTLATAVYYVMPVVGASVWYEVISASAVVATLVGVRRHRPTKRVAWYLFAAGLFCNLCGDLTFAYYETVLGITTPFPSLADFFYLLQYPFYAAALTTMIRSRQPGGDLPGLLDSTIITTGVGVLVWIYLVVPYADDPALTLAERAISVSYALMDILLLLAAVKLAVAPGRSGPATRVLPVVFLVLVATDSVYAVRLLNGTYGFQDPIDVGWLLSYVVIGALALHPSMATLTERATGERSEGLSSRRLILLAVASLLAPAVMFVQAIRDEPLHVPVVAGGSTVLFLLVLARMSGLISAVTSSLDGYRQAVERERILRRAAAALGRAQTHDDIYQAAIEAATELCADIADAEVSIYRGSKDEFAAVAGTRPSDHVSGPPVSPPGRASASEIGMRPVPAPRERVAANGSVVGERSAAPGMSVPVIVLDEVTGLLTINGSTSVPESLRGALETLASQLALALEGAALAQDLLERQSEARFRSLVHNSSDVISIIDSDGVIRYQSPCVRQVFGFGEEELVGEHFGTWLHEDDREAAAVLIAHVAERPEATAAAEWRIRHRDGTWLPGEVHARNLLDDPNVRGIVLTIRDVSERKNLEDELTRLAFHDGLTGLPNRALFKNRVEHALSERSTSNAPPAVLFFDLDDFKTINDSMGHTVGDELLKAVAGRLRNAVRPADTVARLGGDEFAVLLQHVIDKSVPGRVADRILQSLTLPIVLQEREIFAHGSIGISLADSDDTEAEDLLRDADVAMYMAKSLEEHGHQTFQPIMRTAVTKRLELKADLQRAMEEGQFHLVYQPIIRLEDQRIAGVEALLRWRHPERGTVPPLEFISVAEETGMIVPLGRWVLETACAQAVQWTRAHPNHGPLSMSVNLSSRQVQEAHMVGEVASILRDTDLDPSQLTLEITESVLMQDTDAAVDKLNRLRSLGVKLAIDDFGTGYSSLSYLERFPIDILKIDKSFVDGMADGNEESSLAGAIVKLSRALGLCVVAEGIEGADQMKRLVELRCELGQGYHFAKPLDAEQMSLLLATGLAGSSPVLT